MSSLLYQLNPLYNDIANLLGELAGNEAYLDLLESYAPTSLTSDDPMGQQPEHTRQFVAEFTVPGTYGFTFQHIYYGVDIGYAKPGDEIPIDTEKRIAKEAEAAWHTAANSYSASTGNAATLRSWGQNVWEPEVSDMASGLDKLIYVKDWLHEQAIGSDYRDPSDSGAPEWLKKLKTQWPATSKSSNSFYVFWDDVNEKCALYLDAAERLAATSAQTAATVNDFQANLLEVTTKAKDHVVLALKQWQSFKGPSGAWPDGTFTDQSGAKTILGGVSYGTGVVALFPPASLVAGGISVVTGGLSYLLDDKVENLKLTTAAEAIDIWTGYYNDVDTVTTHMGQALDKVRSEPAKDSNLSSASQSFQSLVADVKDNRRDWEPKPVDL